MKTTNNLPSPELYASKEADEKTSKIVKANCSLGHTHRLARVYAEALVKDGTYKWTDDDEITWRGEPHYKVATFETSTNRDGVLMAKNRPVPEMRRPWKQ